MAAPHEKVQKPFKVVQKFATTTSSKETTTTTTTETRSRATTTTTVTGSRHSICIAIVNRSSCFMGLINAAAVQVMRN